MDEPDDPHYLQRLAPRVRCGGLIVAHGLAAALTPRDRGGLAALIARVGRIPWPRHGFSQPEPGFRLYFGSAPPMAPLSWGG